MEKLKTTIAASNTPAASHRKSRTVVGIHLMDNENKAKLLRKGTLNGVLQKKLIIGSSNDPAEKEADEMAERVMRMPDNAVALMNYSKPIASVVHRKCANCEEEQKLQKKSENNRRAEVDAPLIVSNVIKSSGQQLDSKTKNFMESRFGFDFSIVRIHNDTTAHHSSAAINALAYTHQNHIVFGAGQYQPQTRAGKHLLAHELTHVVQQKAARQVYDKTDSGKNTLNGYNSMTHSSFSQDKIQRVTGIEESAAIAALSWCLSGMLVTLAFDEIGQGFKWLIGPKGEKFKQNWCSTILSALFGCVFGVAGGAFEKMFLAEGLSPTLGTLSRWVIKKLLSFGYTNLAGKLALFIAKAGCDDSKVATSNMASTSREGIQ